MTEQYTNIPISYLFVSSEEDNDDYTLEFIIDNKTQDQLTIKANVLGSHNLYFENSGAYSLTVQVVETQSRQTGVLDIKPYNGNIPTIKPDDGNLMLYLNPKGKANNAIDRNEWKSSHINKRPEVTATLTNLYYGTTNGWLTDAKDGTEILRLSSGARLNIPES